ncbi:hypothetical protein BDV35DRAFT_118688 [Aspergillus flavus]|uniref:Uncharacterized protein n=1 Tax=Aspergillus flavus TaxID=5059 RepID=A0A5N6GH84_ASPFL|nr:hypothetical protein BDV35DRAFT_118688 [Aspergillus flavus]
MGHRSPDICNILQRWDILPGYDLHLRLCKMSQVLNRSLGFRTSPAVNATILFIVTAPATVITFLIPLSSSNNIGPLLFAVI